MVIIETSFYSKIVQSEYNTTLQIKMGKRKRWKHKTSDLTDLSVY